MLPANFSFLITILRYLFFRLSCRFLLLLRRSLSFFLASSSAVLLALSVVVFSRMLPSESRRTSPGCAPLWAATKSGTESDATLPLDWEYDWGEFEGSLSRLALLLLRDLSGRFGGRDLFLCWFPSVRDSLYLFCDLFRPLSAPELPLVLLDFFFFFAFFNFFNCSFRFLLAITLFFFRYLIRRFLNLLRFNQSGTTNQSGNHRVQEPRKRDMLARIGYPNHHAPTCSPLTVDVISPTIYQQVIAKDKFFFFYLSFKIDCGNATGYHNSKRTHCHVWRKKHRFQILQNFVNYFR